MNVKTIVRRNCARLLFAGVAFFLLANPQTQSILIMSVGDLFYKIF